MAQTHTFHDDLRQLGRGVTHRGDRHQGSRQIDCFRVVSTLPAARQVATVGAGAQ